MTLYSHAPELFHPRSPHWPAVERRVRARDGNRCRGCGQDGTGEGGELNVHHIVPFHERPDLELVDANCVTAARWCCHLPVCHRDPHTGHTGWSYFDPDCVKALDAKRKGLRP